MLNLKMYMCPTVTVKGRFQLYYDHVGKIDQRAAANLNHHREDELEN
jgi:hypothetical protein